MPDSFDQIRTEYLARQKQALRQLGLADLDLLAEVIETYHRLESMHLPSSWPNLPEAVMHPVRTAHRDFPPDLPVPPELAALTLIRPQANEHWEQLPCLPASCAARREAMRPYLKAGQSLLLLGDDDLMSLFLQDPQLDLTVLDIDAGLLDFLKTHGFTGRLLHQDLHQAHPPDHYDLILTDPPWAHHGMQTFLNAALSCLKPGGLLFLSTQPAMLENRALFQAKLAPLELLQSWPDLNRYPYPETMLEDVIFHLARYDLDPELVAQLFGCPYLWADFLLYRFPEF
jgi:hypothetical protein